MKKKASEVPKPLQCIQSMNVVKMVLSYCVFHLQKEKKMNENWGELLKQPHTVEKAYFTISNVLVLVHIVKWTALRLYKCLCISRFTGLQNKPYKDQLNSGRAMYSYFWWAVYGIQYGSFTFIFLFSLSSFFFGKSPYGKKEFEYIW